LIIIRDIDALPSLSSPVVTIGSFDGVHLGHQQILRRVINEADQISGTSVLLTFTPHPRMVLDPKGHKISLLQTDEEKWQKLADFGLNYTIMYPFTTDFSKLSAQEYVEQLLVRKLGVHTLVIGYDHRFGSRREGSIAYLKEVSGKLGFRVIEIPAEEIDEVNVSSTKIRKAIASGRVEQAMRYLGKPYVLSGEVVKGRQLGRKLGYPTANLGYMDEHKLLPATGVYAGTTVFENIRYKCMVNIGKRPTVSDDETVQVEVHLLDAKLDLYGKTLMVFLHHRLRDEMAFESLDQLQLQLKKDEVIVRNYPSL
jgi:riboflavin kinase/FMN adenylyltransferase